MSLGVVASHAVAAGGGGGFAAAVLADTPQLYWNLDEASGTTATDLSGNSRNGTDTAGITPGAASLLSDSSGKSRSFTFHTSTGIAIASAAWMNVSAFTVEALVKFSSAPDATSGDCIASRYGGSGFQWLLWRNFTGKLALQINTAGSGFVNVADTATVVLGTTYLVTATWDGTNVKLFVNGTQVGSTGTATGALAASTESFRVGAYSASASTVPGALIDEVSFYNAALSGARVTAHAAAA